MANNSQPSSAQPHWPPAVGSMGPQSYGSPLSSQFRPVVPTQQGQHFVPAASQQFRPVGQVPSPNIGMPAVQNQQMQFSQPMQQFPPRPNQPGLSTPSQQPIQSYAWCRSPWSAPFIIWFCAIFFRLATEQCQCTIAVSPYISSACTCCPSCRATLVVNWKSECFTCYTNTAY
ncbi:hypothetical protein V6Z12_D06G027500 [Gossypium hirsutum]